MGLTPASSSGSGSDSGGSVTVIGSQTLAVAAATIGVSLIPATYRALQVVALLRSTRANAIESANLVLNGDTTRANYLATTFTNNQGSSTSPQQDVALLVAGNSAAAGQFSAVVATIGGYATTTYKASVNWQSTVNLESGDLMQVGGGGWNSTAVVNAVSFTPLTGPNWLAGSSIAVYGLS
jgi:hypothetical protein